MPTIQIGKTKYHVNKVLMGLFCVGIFAALIWRIQCSISYYDEVLNVYVSYTTAVLGQRHLVENSYIFSMGDIFNLPFIYLFYHITGGTEGIILFIRFVYLGYNMLLMLVFYLAFEKYCGKVECILFGFLFITFFPGGMYTVCYDTAAIFFTMLSCIALLASEVRGNAGADKWRLMAGISHACMVYAYPGMILTIIVLWIALTIWHRKVDNFSIKQQIRYWVPYLCGGASVLAIFCIYATYVGWHNLFFMKSGFAGSHLRGRTVGEIAIAGSQGNAQAQSGVIKESVQQSAIVSMIWDIGKKVFELLNYMWIQQKKTVVCTVLMLIEWGVGLKKDGKWRLLLIPQIILVAFLFHLNIKCWGPTTMYAYCFCWSPFLLAYLNKKERKWGMLIFIIFGLTAIASFLAIGFTSIVASKAHVGLIYGAVGTFLLMLMLIRQQCQNKEELKRAVIMMIIICNMIMAYRNHFQGADIWNCDYRMQTGIFKGIMTWEQDIKYEQLKQDLEKTGCPKGTTMLLINPNDYAAALDGEYIVYESGMLMEEGLLRDGEKPSAIYNTTGWPPLVILGKDDEETYHNIKTKILDEYYNLTTSENAYYVYTRKE